MVDTHTRTHREGKRERERKDLQDVCDRAARWCCSVINLRCSCLKGQNALGDSKLMVLVLVLNLVFSCS